MITAQTLRDRIRWEDNLINERMNIFLVVNGLGAVAVGIGSSSGNKCLIALVGVAVNILWIVLSIQCLRISFRLTKHLVKLGLDPVELIVQSTLGACLLLRPNAILLIYIPLIIQSAWVVGLWNLCKGLIIELAD